MRDILFEKSPKYAHYESLEGARRKESSNDFHLVDEQQEQSLTLGRRLDFTAFQFLQRHQTWLELEVRHRKRTGFIADNRISSAGSTAWLFLRFTMTL